MKKFFKNASDWFCNYIIGSMFTYAFLNTAWAILIILLIVGLINA